jgi:hypothetical protein
VTPSAALILTGIVLGGLGILVVGLMAWQRVKAHAARDTLNGYDYVLFEIEPSDLSLLSSDMASNGWKSISTTDTQTAAKLYRFERGNGDAVKLGDICLDFDRYMPLTASRKSDALVKIKDHGMKRDPNAQTH